ncbi:MAG: retropepsin-like aspartic protease [bacterium]
MKTNLSAHRYGSGAPPSRSLPSRTAVFVLVFAAGACGTQPLPPPGDRLASGERVAAQFIESHIYVPVTIAGRERLWVLDCGAGGSVIDREFAEELKLAVTGDVEAVGASGSVKAGFATVPGLSVGGMDFDSQPMVVLDIAEMMREAIGTAPAGIIGYDFISRFVTRIDFAEQSVTFYRPEEFEYRGDGKQVTMRLAGNIPTVEMAVDGAGTGWWRLDIGASVSTFHHQGVLKYRLAELPGVQRVARGVGGRQRVNWVRLGHAELAGYRVEKPLFSVPLEGAGGALASSNVAGTLGNSVLRNFSL